MGTERYGERAGVLTPASRPERGWMGKMRRVKLSPGVTISRNARLCTHRGVRWAVVSPENSSKIIIKQLTLPQNKLSKTGVKLQF